MAPSLICPPETAFIMKKTITLGLMSGTSLDGVDAVAVDFAGTSPVFLGHHYQAFPKEVRAELLSLCSPGDNEIDRAGRMSVTLAKLYAQAIHELLNEADIPRMEVAAAGVHGQTIRDRRLQKPRCGRGRPRCAPGAGFSQPGLHKRHRKKHRQYRRHRQHHVPAPEKELRQGDGL